VRIVCDGDIPVTGGNRELASGIIKNLDKDGAFNDFDFSPLSNIDLSGLKISAYESKFVSHALQEALNGQSLHWGSGSDQYESGSNLGTLGNDNLFKPAFSPTIRENVAHSHHEADS
jgi:hypothetical protein